MAALVEQGLRHRTAAAAVAVLAEKMPLVAQAEQTTERTAVLAQAVLAILPTQVAVEAIPQTAELVVPHKIVQRAARLAYLETLALVNRDHTAQAAAVLDSLGRTQQAVLVEMALSGPA